MLKRGARGCVVDGRGYEPRPADVVDTTGAGDAFAAGFLLGGPELALDAAARCVAQLGRDAVNELVRVAPEVADALRRRAAVVALETTLVAHGFPGEEGVAVALESERRVRAAGACRRPSASSTAASGSGSARTSCAASTPSARKVGPRDLAACAVQGALGATTVGGTLAACRVAGIGFMGTGGLGGVHRGFPHPPDVSADLGELARTEVVVVSSGVKSLLDVPATVELLETLGIPVLGWRTDTLPLFYAAHGGPPVSARVENAAEAARIARAHWQLGRRSALVLARPPAESLDDVEPLIERALAASRAAGRLGAGRDAVRARLPPPRERRPDARANSELIADNAGLAGEVAVAYAALSSSSQ